MARYRWKKYVPVSVRRERAEKKTNQMRNKEKEIHPVTITGRRITHTFWGNAWCQHLEHFSDFSNRLPRGRTYVRNGSVCHLEIAPGQVKALVAGSSMYRVEVSIAPLSGKKWKTISQRCTNQIGSLLELLEGRLSDEVMHTVLDPQEGLFPKPREIEMECSCPDWAIMCKHVAAVLYGVGARLDEQPELLFVLRGVDHQELITSQVSATVTAAAGEERTGRRYIDEANIADLFGIDVPQPEDSKQQPETAQPTRQTTGKAPAKPSTRKRKAVTGKQVGALRRKFDMNQTDFALLMGVSPTTISRWEAQPGPLKLQPASLRAWDEARKLSFRQARIKVSEICWPEVE